MKITLSREEIVGAVRDRYSENIREAGINNPVFWWKLGEEESVYFEIEVVIEEDEEADNAK